MRLKFRLLPVTMFALGLMVTIKVGGMWQGAVPIIESVAIATSQAQQGPEEEAEMPEKDGEMSAVDVEEEPVEPLLESDFDATSDTAGLDPSAMSQSELDVLQRLRQRREDLNARATLLDMRENTLKAAEHALGSRIEDWKELKQEVEAMLGVFDEKQDDDLKTLALYYEKMKPKDAARVFNALDMSYLIDIVQRMKNGKVAVIIGKMETEKAKNLTVELAERMTRRRPTGEAVSAN